MTTVAVDGKPGKFQVLFNGSTISCYNDTECPGAGICAINQTWAVQPGGFCMCFTRGGLSGDKCNEICELGQARLGIGIVVIMLSVIVAVLALAALLSYCHASQPIRRIFNALNVTLLSLSIGSILMIAYNVMLFITTLGFADNYVVIEIGGRLMRRTAQQSDYATFILLALAQCISCIAPLLLPLLWIDMATSIFRFKRRSVKALHFFSIVACCIVCFVQIPLYVLAANNFQGGAVYYGQIAAYIWYAVYGFIVLVNLVAAFLIISAQIAIKQRPQSEANIRFIKLLQRVLKAAIALVICFSCAIGLIQGGQARQSRTYYSDPTCNVVNGSVWTLSDLCLRLAILSIISASVVCMWLVFPDVYRLISLSSTPSPAVNTPGRFHNVQNAFNPQDSAKIASDSHPPQPSEFQLGQIARGREIVAT